MPFREKAASAASVDIGKGRLLFLEARRWGDPRLRHSGRISPVSRRFLAWIDSVVDIVTPRAGGAAFFCRSPDHEPAELQN
jgi:hypothetical protein